MAREELAVFLARRVVGEPKAGAWRARFAHWWDENPFAGLVAERGWVLRDGTDGSLVGFLGLIPVCYARDGEPVPAVTPTTWAVDPRHRQSAMKLGRRLARLEGRLLIVCTTGRKDFQQRLVRRGWVLNAEAVRQFVPCGRAARWWLGPPPPLPAGCRIVTNINDVAAIAQACQDGSGIEKWISLDYLRWYLHSPARAHSFIGMVNEEGCLSSFLILASTPVLRVLQTGSVVDWFGSGPCGAKELRALLAQAAGTTPRWTLPLLRLTITAGDSAWAGVRGLLRAPVTLNHFHLPPAAWTPLAKRCVLAEGDLGL